MRIFLTLLILCLFAAHGHAQERGALTGQPAPQRERLPQRADAPGAQAPVRGMQAEQKEKAPDFNPRNALQAHGATNALEREILIFTGRGARAEALSELNARGLDLIEEFDLDALGGALFVTRGSPAILQSLRNALPDAEVDWNDDLSASAGPRLYAKDKIDWPAGGACLKGALKIPIGLIDGRIDRAHPAFAGQVILEKSFLDEGRADARHATAIASILVGNAPEQGFDGLLTGAKLYSAIALRNAPNDSRLASIEATLRGLNWLMREDVRLINVSLAGKKNRVLVRAFEKSLVRGTLVFAAAGNNGPVAPPAYPAAIAGVFAVTATDALGRPYKHANTGDYIDFSAPGVDIWAAAPGGEGAYHSGTSFAAPYALAAVALQLSKNPNLSAAMVARIFEDHKNISAWCP